MTAADDVVQAYRLPKYQHLQLQPLAGPSNSEPAHSEPSPVKSAVSDLADSSRRLTLEVIEDGDGDEDMEQVAPTAVSLIEGMPLREPKTMRELAADAARARASKTSSDSEVEVLDSPPRKPGRGSGRNARTTNSVNSVRGKMTRTTRSSVPRPTSNDIIPDTQPTASRRSTRQTARKRMREEEDDPSESFEADAEASDARPRRTRRGAAAPAVSEKRVLRPRKRKTAAQLEEEDEMEGAYRQAAEDSDE
jgi:xeroderma pigmentosum group C-complementing protein